LLSAYLTEQGVQLTEVVQPNRPPHSGARKERATEMRCGGHLEGLVSDWAVTLLP